MAGYLLYSLVSCSFLLATVLYFTRERWLDHIPRGLYSKLPSFANDIEDGLTSDDFDLSNNVVSGDRRSGLDTQGKQEIKRIMKRRAVGFDEARRIYTESRFAKNNIGPDGRPRDPKFVSFS
ncbi:hypothetical protein MMC10_007386 [Thelotrema lepadinum]|nr:hypothetical protein [Thelotrema lepadinum]